MMYVHENHIIKVKEKIVFQDEFSSEQTAGSIII